MCGSWVQIVRIDELELNKVGKNAASMGLGIDVLQ